MNVQEIATINVKRTKFLILGKTVTQKLGNGEF